MTTFSLYSILDFGKYKGKKLIDILSSDPQYLLWAVQTIRWFKVPKYLFDDITNLAAERTAAKEADRLMRRNSRQNTRPNKGYYGYYGENYGENQGEYDMLDYGFGSMW